MRKATKVYVAGPLTPKLLWSPNPAIDYLLNVRNMIEAGKECLLQGLSPFVPGIDFNFFLHLKENEHITEEIIKNYSLDWMLVCDVVLLLAGWESSKGTLIECDIAAEHNIPIFRSIRDIKKWEEERNNASV